MGEHPYTWLLRRGTKKLYGYFSTRARRSMREMSLERRRYCCPHKLGMWELWNCCLTEALILITLDKSRPRHRCSQLPLLVTRALLYCFLTEALILLKLDNYRPRHRCTQLP